MIERTKDVPEEVRKFAPKQQPRSPGDPTDMAGEALIAMLQHAANISDDKCNAALTTVDELDAQLRSAEDRIKQLEADVEFHRNRAARGESWLRRIQKEVEESLIAPRGKPSGIQM